MKNEKANMQLAVFDSSFILHPFFCCASTRTRTRNAKLEAWHDVHFTIEATKSVLSAEC